MKQATNLDLQSGSLLDKLASMSSRRLPHLIILVNRQSAQSIAVDCCMKDRFQIVSISLEVGGAADDDNASQQMDERSVYQTRLCSRRVARVDGRHRSFRQR
jgi:hypothetical protein